MPPKFHTAVGYRLFSHLADQMAVSIQRKIFPFLGFSNEEIERRLLQRFTELGLGPFIKLAADHYRCKPVKSIFEQDQLQFAGMKCDLSGGRLNISFALFGKSMLEFATHWLLVLWAHLQAFFTFHTSGQHPATIVFGVGAENFYGPEKDAGFINFCRQGPVTPLREASSLIVMDVSGAQSSDPSYVEYAHFPLFALTRRRDMGFYDFFKFFVSHIGVALLFLISVLRFPLLVTLGRDFAYHAMVVRLNRNKAIENVLITNSNYTSQPLWMVSLVGRRFSTHIAFYSMNIMPFVYQHDRVETHLPNYDYMKVDALWVWTEYYSHCLKSIGVKGTMHVTGPILWYLPKYLPDVEQDNGDTITIALFDVTPYQQVMEEKLGMVYNYYSASNVEMFLNDVCRVCEQIKSLHGKKVLITLKHKREYHPMHDQGYIEFVEELERSKQIQLVDPGQNLYEMIAGSDITIVLPYSSPVHIAVSMGKHAIFYDPSEELLPAYEQSSLVSFAAGREALLASINEILSESQ